MWMPCHIGTIVKECADTQAAKGTMHQNIQPVKEARTETNLTSNKAICGQTLALKMELLSQEIRNYCKLL